MKEWIGFIVINLIAIIYFMGIIYLISSTGTKVKKVKKMINGIDYLKEMYPNREDKDYQPSGMDLRLGNVFYLDVEEDGLYGLIDGEKLLPEHKPVKPSLLKVRKDDYVAGWFLEPQVPYICQVRSQIKIGNKNAQFYLPRSTLLRAGVNVYTALGDLGYNGHLSFLVINHGPQRFFIQTNERFAQLIDFEVKGGSESYDGDYQEEEL